MHKEQKDFSQKDTKIFIPLQAIKGGAQTNRSPTKRNIIKACDKNSSEKPIKMNEPKKENVIIIYLL